MQVKEIMSVNPVRCTPETPLQNVARLMVEHDCGEIPVIVNWETGMPIGVVTDRDITCRAVAEGRNPLEMTARDVMSSPVVTVTPETDVNECCRIMEENMIRRIPVVDQNGVCCGLVSQADIAVRGTEEETAEVVRSVSRPTVASSLVA